MRVFRTTARRNRTKPKTTEDFFIGAPEAEAETLASSEMQLGEVFSDFLGILPSLSGEKFVLLGRKGSGKTAIAEYIAHLAKEEPNTFCDFVRRADLTLEDAVQSNDIVEHSHRATLLFEWLILVKFARLMVGNNALNDTKLRDHLEKFLRKNAGYVDINEYDAQQFLSGKDFEIDITHFKRFVQAKFNRSLQITSKKAPFYKVIPSLKESILSLMSSVEDRSNGNQYILIFDDLDIGFKASDERSIGSLVSLLRVAKHYNVNEFGKKGIDAKIIVLLRDDIARIASGGHADTAKLFSSYGIWLSWYEQQDYQHGGETQITLREFINRRIAYNFNKFGWPISDDPWVDFIDAYSSHYGSKTAFKFILDHSFYRPRDLILFFMPIAELNIPIPISHLRVKELILRFAREVLQEIRNELSAQFSDSEVNSILSILGHFAKNRLRFNYQDFESRLQVENLDLDAEDLLGRLFEYSLVGNITEEGHVTLKHRQERHEHFDIDLEQQIIVHTALIAHYSGRVWN